MNEIWISLQIKSPYLNKIYGVSYNDKKKRLYSIHEKADYNMESFLKSRIFSLKELNQIAQDASKCVEILHMHNLIHLDLKPDNYLVFIDPNDKS